MRDEQGVNMTETWLEIVRRRLEDGTAFTRGFTMDEIQTIKDAHADGELDESTPDGLVAFGTDLTKSDSPAKGVRHYEAIVDEDLYIRGSDGMMSTLYFALSEYRDTLLNDLATCFNGSDRYSTEDDMFLGGTIGTVARIMFELEQANDGISLGSSRPVYQKVDKPVKDF